MTPSIRGVSRPVRRPVPRSVADEEAFKRIKHRLELEHTLGLSCTRRGRTSAQGGPRQPNALAAYAPRTLI
ncbi:MAG: hypothetical protein IPK02_14190 [Candidatus Accumulibacter sp.]|uniref:Uncharacterized protein n=1 Tax=Candidatus Accumulibacter affinis TaxID=2954384 RepID=A0A935W5I7_9PROT|nr:hypothetical protein [Candidatus Accumulibacter affinis]